jgi:hypothetical protein
MERFRGRAFKEHCGRAARRAHRGADHAGGGRAVHNRVDLDPDIRDIDAYGPRSSAARLQLTTSALTS